MEATHNAASRAFPITRENFKPQAFQKSRMKAVLKNPLHKGRGKWLQRTDELHPFFCGKRPFNHRINFRQFGVEIDEAVVQDGLVQVDQVG